MKYPALDVTTDEADLVLATVDDFCPTAAEEQHGVLTLYFTDTLKRDRARDAVARAHPDTSVTCREVDDGDWARRSQQNLKAVTVGSITVAPPWATPPVSPSASSAPHAITIVVRPSTGFGTGHHPTTRLCLRALQAIELTGKSVLDVGTGSGVLAMAARALGAERTLGIDHDPDAVHAAMDNLPLNPSLDRVVFSVSDLDSGQLPVSDVVVANLTGALLCRARAGLSRAVRANGRLIVSGLQTHERTEVVAAFGPGGLEWEAEEEGWVGILFRIAG